MLKDKYLLCLFNKHVKEFQETERSLMVQNCVQQMSGDGCGWSCRSTSDGVHVVSPSRSGLSPVCTPSERLPGTRGRVATVICYSV